MFANHTIGIVTRGEGRNTEITIDGNPLKGVTSIGLTIGLEGPPILTITMFGDVEYQGDHAITFTRETVRTLCRECGRIEERATGIT